MELQQHTAVPVNDHKIIDISAVGSETERVFNEVVKGIQV